MKILIKFIAIILCFITSSAFADESVKSLSFSQLKGMEDYLQKDASVQLLQRQLGSYHEHKVSIRGFLYETADHNWILASEPNLKSCCTGSANKVAHQIHISGEITPENISHAVTVEGTFYIHPVWNEDGVLAQLYSIQHASIVPDNSWPMSTVAFAGGGIIGLVFLCILLSKKPPIKPADE